MDRIFLGAEKSQGVRPGQSPDVGERETRQVCVKVAQGPGMSSYLLEKNI